MEYNADIEYKHEMSNVKIPDNLVKVDDLRMTYQNANIMKDRTA